MKGSELRKLVRARLGLALGVRGFVAERPPAVGLWWRLPIVGGVSGGVALNEVVERTVFCVQPVIEIRHAVVDKLIQASLRKSVSPYTMGFPIGSLFVPPVFVQWKFRAVNDHSADVVGGRSVAGSEEVGSDAIGPLDVAIEDMATAIDQCGVPYLARFRGIVDIRDEAVRNQLMGLGQKELVWPAVLVATGDVEEARAFMSQELRRRGEDWSSNSWYREYADRLLAS